MSAADITPDSTRRPITGRRVRFGDVSLQVVAGAAAAAATFLVFLIAYKVVRGAQPAIVQYGLRFVARIAWDPVKNVYGAGSFLFGTALTSLLALAIAAPIAIGI
ncbi:MAG: phosphate transport system permease protein, partial [Gaiellaceae bacterium]|nr:phosphate transport system permease protein [Gaiellaceae bacterium]